MLIEVCCGHFEAAKSAIENGAERIELCAALPLGGITPSIECIKSVADLSAVPVMVLIRPREGNFTYSQIEKKIIYSEIESAINANATGIVIGALNDSDTIDLNFIKEIKKSFNGIPITFHRAFDFTKNPLEAMKQLIDIGIERILTSGTKPSAIEGKEVLKRLIEQAGDRILIMPGAGINSKNITLLVDYLHPKEIHLSAKKTINGEKDQAFGTDLFHFDPKEFKLCSSIIHH